MNPRVGESAGEAPNPGRVQMMKAYIRVQFPPAYPVHRKTD
jgi:hypothetical protein